MELTSKQEFLMFHGWTLIKHGLWRSPLYPHFEHDEDYAYKFQRMIDSAFEEKEANNG